MQSSITAGIAIAAALCTFEAHADVVESDAHSASIRIVVPLSVSPGKAYDAFVQPAKWWDSEHTFSGDAARLRLKPVAGGCFCERLPGGGSVLHMTVVHVAPKVRITLSGGLGPLQTAGVAGAMNIAFSAKDAGAELVLVYNLGGYYPKGLDTVAPLVDQVLRQQMERLKQFAETGKVEDAPKKP